MSTAKVGQIWETSVGGDARRAVVEEVLDGVGQVLVRFHDDGATTTVAVEELSTLPDGTWRLVSDALAITTGDERQGRPFGQVTG